MLSQTSKESLIQSLNIILSHIDNMDKEYKRLPSNNDEFIECIIKCLSQQCNIVLNYIK